MTLPLWPQQDLGPVRRGDIFAIGRHRLACIDATNKADVARLFDGRKPTLVVTSPPYADARDYNDPIPCWDSMMLGALNGHPFAADVQMLINLGVIHRKGEFMPYWNAWVAAMRTKGWAHFGQYIWAKKAGLPGSNHGRPRPCHEFIFHFNSQPVRMNKTLQCKWHGKDKIRAHGLKTRNGLRQKHVGHVGLPVQSHKILDSVLHIHSETNNRTGHPAVYPIALPSMLIAAYKTATSLVYDPFSGASTTLLASEQEGVVGLAAEISPAYVHLAIDRWRKAHPDKPVTRVS